MRRNAPGSRQRGFVLIVVLGAVLTLSALLFGFNHTARTSLEAADTFRSSEQALNCARGGLNIVIAMLRQTDDIWTEPRFATLLTGENTFSLGNGSCSVTVTEENGRLNVNHLINKEGQPDRRPIDQVLRLIDLLNRHKATSQRIAYDWVPALIDWIDTDDKVARLSFIKGKSEGAEHAYYRTLSPPYHCKNAPLDTIDELLWVKDVTPEAFGVLRELLTTVGDGKININAAPIPVIASLSEKLDLTLAQMIVSQRKLKPFGSLTELRNVPGMTDNIYLAIKDTITIKPTERYYHVTSQGNEENRSCRIEAVLQRNTQTGNVDTVSYREL